MIRVRACSLFELTPELRGGARAAPGPGDRRHTPVETLESISNFEASRSSDNAFGNLGAWIGFRNEGHVASSPKSSHFGIGVCARFAKGLADSLLSSAARRTPKEDRRCNSPMSLVYWESALSNCTNKSCNDSYTIWSRAVASTRKNYSTCEVGVLCCSKWHGAHQKHVEGAEEQHVRLKQTNYGPGGPREKGW